MITYDENEKENLCAFLYPTHAYRNYILNDFNQELAPYLPDKIIMSNENIKNKVRAKNYKKTKNIMRKFLENNPVHKKLIKDFYADLDMQDMVELMIINYVFYRSQMIDEVKNLSIFFNPHFVTYEATRINAEMNIKFMLGLPID